VIYVGQASAGFPARIERDGFPLCVSQREKLETGNDPPRKRVSYLTSIRSVPSVVLCC